MDKFVCIYLNAEHRLSVAKSSSAVVGQTNTSSKLFVSATKRNIGVELSLVYLKCMAANLSQQT